MYHTQLLNKAIEKAKKCNCIICETNLTNLESAEEYWRSATRFNDPIPHRKFARDNFRVYVEKLIEQKRHLIGYKLHEVL
jgi:hypothetical protein